MGAKIAFRNAEWVGLFGGVINNEVEVVNFDKLQPFTRAQINGAWVLSVVNENSRMRKVILPAGFEVEV